MAQAGLRLPQFQAPPHPGQPEQLVTGGHVPAEPAPQLSPTDSGTPKLQKTEGGPRRPVSLCRDDPSLLVHSMSPAQAGTRASAHICGAENAVTGLRPGDLRGLNWHPRPVLGSGLTAPCLGRAPPRGTRGSGERFSGSARPAGRVAGRPKKAPWHLSLRRPSSQRCPGGARDGCPWCRRRATALELSGGLHPEAGPSSLPAPALTVRRGQSPDLSVPLFLHLKAGHEDSTGHSGLSWGIEWAEPSSPVPGEAQRSPLHLRAAVAPAEVGSVAPSCSTLIYVQGEPPSPSLLPRHRP